MKQRRREAREQTTYSGYRMRVMGGAAQVLTEMKEIPSTEPVVENAQQEPH
jgi:hypothetical protein